MPSDRWPAPSRRSFLTGAAAGGVTAALGPALVPVSHLLPAAGAQQLDAVGFAAFAESIELAIVDAYEAAIGLLAGDDATVAETVAGHHREHATVFAEHAGDAATGEASTALAEALTPLADQLAGRNDALRFAVDLENQLVATYAWALSTLSDRSAASLVATVLPVESAHAARLADLVGEGLEGLFPFGPFESADIANGLDPSVFPAG